MQRVMGVELTNFYNLRLKVRIQNWKVDLHSGSSSNTGGGMGGWGHKGFNVAMATYLLSH